MEYMPLVTGITIIYPLIMLKTDSMVERFDDENCLPFVLQPKLVGRRHSFSYF